MKRQRHTVNANVSVRCTCGWSGLRAAGSTQPCPACTKPLDATEVSRQRAVYQKRHNEKKAREARCVAEAIASANEAQRVADRAENEKISAMLRAAREEAQR